MIAPSFFCGRSLRELKRLVHNSRLSARHLFFLFFVLLNLASRYVFFPEAVFGTCLVTTDSGHELM